MKALFKVFTSKLFLMFLIVCLQIGAFAMWLMFLQEKIPYFYIGSGIIAVMFVLYIVNADINPAYKIAWIIPIAALPVFGIGAYILFGKKKLNKKTLKKHKAVAVQMQDALTQDNQILNELQGQDSFFYNLSRYLYADSHFPVHSLKDAVYFPSGESFFERLKKELSKAKDYIFLEFFIIDKGKMWGEILEILKTKAKEGIDVRLIYDDAGTIMRVGHSYRKYLTQYGIKVYLFNPFLPIVDSQLNNRTHRKIVVIDGKCAFTGGVNLADEYINEKTLFGHWKDSAVMITGSGVINFTFMFLQLWAFKYGKEDFDKYIVKDKSAEQDDFGYIVPFSDSPHDNKNVYENVYIKSIYNAKEYVYINTPYLILDNEMKTALITAARSGVDVRICVPHKPDKRYVFVLTRAFYTELVMQGVKVYEYLPGFLHAKSLVCDGKYTVIGTSNMDFRSFYLHFECGAAVLCQDLAATLTKDFLDTVSISREILPEMTKVGVIKRLIRAVLRLFAPLM